MDHAILHNELAETEAEVEAETIIVIDITVTLPTARTGIGTNCLFLFYQ